MGAHLKRSHTDKMIAGVCGGIAHRLGWNSTFIRILFVVLISLGLGAPVIFYFILAVVMPE